MQSTTESTMNLTAYAEEIDSAFAEGTPCVWVTCDRDGRPDIALKGSTMVFDGENLAFLERSHGITIENIRQNPHVAMLYRNRDRKVGQRRFYGEAQVHETGALRDDVRERTVAAERDKDPDNKGIAVVIRVERVVEGGKVVQQRA